MVAGSAGGQLGRRGHPELWRLQTAERGSRRSLLTRRADVDQRARLLLTRAGNRVCPLSELQVAVLLPQLEHLSAWNERRAATVEQLGRLLQDVPGLKLFRNHQHEGRLVYYKVGFQYEATAFGLARSGSSPHCEPRE